MVIHLGIHPRTEKFQNSSTRTNALVTFNWMVTHLGCHPWTKKFETVPHQSKQAFVPFIRMATHSGFSPSFYWLSFDLSHIEDFKYELKTSNRYHMGKCRVTLHYMSLGHTDWYFMDSRSRISTTEVNGLCNFYL